MVYHSNSLISPSCQMLVVRSQFSTLLQESLRQVNATLESAAQTRAEEHAHKLEELSQQRSAVSKDVDLSCSYLSQVIVPFMDTAIILLFLRMKI